MKSSVESGELTVESGDCYLIKGLEGSDSDIMGTALTKADITKDKSGFQNLPPLSP